MTEQQRKNAIDKMTYNQMLGLWRFEPIGSLWFQGEVGDYFKEKFAEKREPTDLTKFSKEKIGWEK